jgi:hypothetical protein
MVTLAMAPLNCEAVTWSDADTTLTAVGMVYQRPCQLYRLTQLKDLTVYSVASLNTQDRDSCSCFLKQTGVTARPRQSRPFPPIYGMEGKTRW